MSIREERIVLAAAAMIAHGRDDRYSVEERASRAVTQADAILSELDATAAEDFDEELERHALKDPPPFEQGYEEGVADAETRAKAQIGELQNELVQASESIKDLQKQLEQTTKPVAPAKK